MRIEISGHQMDVTPALREYAENKIGRLAKHFEQHLDTRMILSVDNLEHKAEATINIPGKTLFADSLAADMYAAIDLLADKLDRRVLKHKEMKADKHAAEARKVTRV